MEKLELPSPIDMSTPFAQVLGRRRSSREFSSEPLDASILSALLWACAGRNAEDGHRTVPSAMDCREVECFVFDADGVWLYDNAQNALLLMTEGDHRMATTAGQDFVGTAPVTLVFAVNKAKTSEISEGRMGEICKSVDVGAMMENALLACAAMGLAAVPRAWLDPAQVLQAMGKTESQYDPQMAVTVGFPL